MHLLLELLFVSVSESCARGTCVVWSGPGECFTAPIVFIEHSSDNSKLCSGECFLWTWSIRMQISAVELILYSCRSPRNDFPKAINQLPTILLFELIHDIQTIAQTLLNTDSTLLFPVYKARLNPPRMQKQKRDFRHINHQALNHCI